MKGIHSGLFVKVLYNKHGIQACSGVACCYLLAEQLCSVNKKDLNIILSGHGTLDTYEWTFVTFHYTFPDNKCLYEYECSDNKWDNKTEDVSKHKIPIIVTDLFKKMRLVSSV